MKHETGVNANISYCTSESGMKQIQCLCACLCACVCVCLHVRVRSLSM